MKFICMSFIGLVSSVAFAYVSLPTNDEIERTCSTSNSIGSIKTFLYPILTNMFHNTTQYPSSEVVRVRSQIYTNMMNFTKSGSLPMRQKVRTPIGSLDHIFLMSWCFGFPNVKNNMTAINEIADYISTVDHGITQDQYLEKIFEGIAKDYGIEVSLATQQIKKVGWTKIKQGENFIKARDYWYPIFHAHVYQDRYRRDIQRAFTEFIINDQLSILTPEEIPAFRSNIVERAKLTDEEAKLMFGDFGVAR